MSRCLRNVTHVSSGAGLAGEFPAAKMCYNEMKGDVIMKSAKNNIRSFRYSDRVAEILASGSGRAESTRLIGNGMSLWNCLICVILSREI